MLSSFNVFLKYFNGFTLVLRSLLRLLLRLLLGPTFIITFIITFIDAWIQRTLTATRNGLTMYNYNIK